MKKNIKGIAAVVVALVLVITAGAYMADHSLKATDGEENNVEIEAEGNTSEMDMALVEEPAAEEETTAEETPADGEASEDGQTPADGEASEDGQTSEDQNTEENSDADTADTTEDTDASKTEEDAEECQHEDADGDGICDKCNEPMPAEEEDVEEEEKEEGTVRITANVDASNPITKGTKITLTAVTEGFGDREISHYQWLRTKDGTNWEIIEGANSSKYTFEMNEDNTGYQWKVRVNVADK